jgi:glycosyltransferase involved in cell wall biosynthesis
MNDCRARVSIGIPVYNGARFLKEAIDSILAQTFEDLELVISDNASTDQTEQICRAYAAKDKRVRYYCNEKNLGAAWNYNCVFELSTGEYFKWQAHDDLCGPRFLEKGVAVLAGDPSIVLCYSKFVRIDEHGNPLKILTSKVTGRGKPHERFRSVILRRNTCEEVFGLMRASALRKTRLYSSYSNCDDNLLAELALQGCFYAIQEPLIMHRIHPGQSTRAYSNRLDRMAWFDPLVAGRIAFPGFRQFFEYLWLIRRSALPWPERLRCYLHMCGWLWKFRRRLGQDLSSVIFHRTIVPTLRKHAPWTRQIWHAMKRTASQL